jgi:hypothetical protein
LIVALIALAALLDRRVRARRGHGAPPRAGTGQDRPRVTVHTRQPDDQTLHGVLVRDYRDRLELEGAEIVTAQGNTTIPGTVHVPAEAVSWLQDHGARS